ncbi:MAG TPA: tail fiber protein [Chloroflexota bacterium]|nr:tail fiber protein [Chloroflexota bacterium]
MDPFLAEIRIVPFNFAPAGWALCCGQLIPISQNTALFSLLGTTYGGDGQSNFALPDLQGRSPMHPGQGAGLSLHDLGESSGSDTVTLTSAEMPVHTHTLPQAVAAEGNQQGPSGNVWAQSRTSLYSPSSASDGTMNASAVGPVGSSQPHNNLPPYLVLNFVIALQGVFPQRP